MVANEEVKEYVELALTEIEVALFLHKMKGVRDVSAKRWLVMSRNTLKMALRRVS